jgi:TetR/AcrR family transcriptional regulator
VVGTALATTDSSAETSPRRERRKDDRPGELVNAALDVFAERGFAGARLEDIARRAGVTKGTVYLYFASKEELFEAVVRQTLMTSIARGQATVRDFEGPTPELLRIVLTGWWHGVVRTKAAALVKLICAEASNFPAVAQFYYDNVIEPGRRLQSRIIERGIARGEFRAVNVEHTVMAIVAAFLYVQVHQWSFAKVIPATAIEGDEFLESFIDFVLGSLMVPEDRR